MPKTNVHQVYVIGNTTGKFYIGLSENVQIRLQQQNHDAFGASLADCAQYIEGRTIIKAQ